MNFTEDDIFWIAFTSLIIYVAICALIDLPL